VIKVSENRASRTDASASVARRGWRDCRRGQDGRLVLRVSVAACTTGKQRRIRNFRPRGGYLPGANRRCGTRVESVAGKLLICPKVRRAGARETRGFLAVVDAGIERTLPPPPPSSSVSLSLVGWPRTRSALAKLKWRRCRREVARCTNYPGMWSLRAVMPS